jgi:peptidoglycan/LPS O-acetylase OafA/YrhL
VVAAAVALVIVALVRLPGSIPAEMMGFGLIAFVGRISYGLYLWHLPVYSAINNAGLHLGLPANLALKVSVTFVFALLSYYLIERRALKLKARLNPIEHRVDY